MPAPHVLVLGGGYVAMYLARGTKRSIRAGELECTVVNRSNFQVFHGFVGEMLTGRVSPSHILQPGAAASSRPRRCTWPRSRRSTSRTSA